MSSLETYLKELGYSDAHIELTMYKLDSGVELPDEVKKDVANYYDICID